MHTKFFQVLTELSQLCEELNVLTPIEDCESTAAFFGTIGDYTLQGKWLCVCLPMDDAVRIAKSSMSILLKYEFDESSILLCCAYDQNACIKRHETNE